MLTLLEKVNNTAPIGIKTMPMIKNEIITGPGVNRGCHAFSRCCLNAVSIVQNYYYYWLEVIADQPTHCLLSGFFAEDLLLANNILVVRLFVNYNIMLHVPDFNVRTANPPEFSLRITDRTLPCTKFNPMGYAFVIIVLNK